jgi:hypothetical protein
LTNSTPSCYNKLKIKERRKVMKFVEYNGQLVILDNAVKVSMEVYEYYGRIQVIYDTGFSAEVVSANPQDIKDLFEEIKKIMEN